MTLAIEDPDDLGMLGIVRADADATTRHLEAHNPVGEPTLWVREAYDLLDSLLARDDPA